MDKINLVKYRYGNVHSHTDYSNLRFLDAVITVPQAFKKASELNYKLIGFTDHGAISSHIKASRYYKSHKDELGDLKPVYGTELYLVDRKEMNEAVEKNERFRFNHFLVNALNKKGHEFLRKVSTLSWENDFVYRGSERVPNFFDEIEPLLQQYKGDVIGSTACLAGTFAQNILKFEETKEITYLQKAKDFLRWGARTFGKGNFYLEIMPSHKQPQLIVNKYAVELSHEMNIPFIITLDSHYLDESQRPIHTALLKSRNIDRDVEAYDTAHFMSVEELFEFFNDDILSEAFKNIQDIYDKVQIFDFEQAPILPKPLKIDDNLKNKSVLSKYSQGTLLEKYPSIKAFSESQYIEDKQLLVLIIEGLKSHNISISNDKYLKRIDLELSELVKINNKLKQPMSRYFLVERDLVNLMWDVSLVGPGRGSSSCWVINYLIGLTQVDSIQYDLPHYRFLSAERVSENRADQYCDIDEDTSASKREDVIEHIKDVYGRDKVLNFGTFSTIQSKNAIKIACRGMQIDNNEADYICSLLSNDSSGKEIDVITAIKGNKDKKLSPNKNLIKEIRQFPSLQETIVGLYGLIVGRSQHASGVFIDNGGYVSHNAMMKTNQGIMVSQFDADDSEYSGMIKFDLLSIDSLDRIENVIGLLQNDGKIDKNLSMREVYNKYFSSEKLDYDNPAGYEMLFKGEIINAFQFSANQGIKTLYKLNAQRFLDLVSANGLMRLRADNSEQPLDRYIRFKNNKGAWDKEMTEYGLNDRERQILHGRLDDYFGVCSSQELLMQMVLDENITGYNLEEANFIRKAIGKKDLKKLAKAKEIFFKKGKDKGQRDIFLTYIWDNEIEIQKG